MAEQVELLTVGRISIDLYCDQIGADWHAATTFSKAVGGSPTNVAIQAARLGHRAAVFTKVGADPFGEVAIRELEDFGVDPRSSARPPMPSRRSRLPRSTRPRTRSCCSAGSRPCPTSSSTPTRSTTAPSAASRSCGSPAAHCRPSRAPRPWRLCSRPAAAGTHTILDLDYRPTFWRSRAEASARIGAAVAHATVAVGNREECAVAVGSDDPHEAARRLLERGVELAIVKLGGDGVLPSNTHEQNLIPPPSIEVLCGLGPETRSAARSATGFSAPGLTSARSRSRTPPAGSSPRDCCAPQAMPFEHEVLELTEGSPA